MTICESRQTNHNLEMLKHSGKQLNNNTWSFSVITVLVLCTNLHFVGFMTHFNWVQPLWPTQRSTQICAIICSPNTIKKKKKKKITVLLSHKAFSSNAIMLKRTFTSFNTIIHRSSVVYGQFWDKFSFRFVELSLLSREVQASFRQPCYQFSYAWHLVIWPRVWSKNAIAV